MFFHSRCVATAVLLCIVAASAPAQEGTALRTSLGTALDPAADGTARYREDSGWNSTSFSSSRWAVEYGTNLSASPWIVVLQQPTRTNAALTAAANQLTLDLAGGTYTVAPFLVDGKVHGGKVIVADKLGSGAYLRIANGTLNNDFGGNAQIVVGDAGAIGRMFVQNANVRTRLLNVGSITAGSPGFLTLEAGSNVEVTNLLQVGSGANGSLTLAGANATLNAAQLSIGGATVVGLVTLDDPTAVLRISKPSGGDLEINNAIPSVPGTNAGLVVNDGTVLIDNQLFLGTRSNRYGAVVINGGRVAVAGSVVYGVDRTATMGGKVFLNDGRFEVASPTAFQPNANQNFYWKNGTLAFTGATTSLTDADVKKFTRQGAASYGGGRAEGTLTTGQTLEAAGSLTLSGDTVTLAGGSVRAGNGLVVNAPIAGYGTLDAVISGTGSITNSTANELVIGGLNGANAIASNGDVRVGQGNLAGTYLGVSTGSGRFIKDGSATQSISGSVLNTGGVTVTSGTLNFSGSTSTLQTSTARVSDGATLRLEAGASGNAAAIDVGTTPTTIGRARLDVAGNGTSLAVVGDIINNGVIELTDGSLNVGGALVNYGQLINNGSLTGAVSGSGVLTGNGVFGGPVSVESGAMLAPGNSPGTASFSDLTLAAGSSFEFEIADAEGVAGVDWDLAAVTGALAVAATSSDPATILLKSLDQSLVGGTLLHFDPTQSWSWKFISASIVDPAAFNSGALQVDSSGFLPWNELEGGSFSAVAAVDGLYVSFTPQPAAVPEPGSLLLFAAVGLSAGGIRTLRRRMRPSSVASEQALARRHTER